MGLTADTDGHPGRSRAARHHRSRDRQGRRRERSVLHGRQCRARRQGLPRHLDRRPDPVGPHRLAHVDDVRSCLLRRRDDADVDAALRRRALRLRAARLAAPVGRDDRRRHADQQDGPGAAQGLRPDAGAALRHLDGHRAPTAAAIIIIPMRSCAAATGSCRSTSMFPAARPRPRRCSTACCCCRRRSAASAPSNAERPAARVDPGRCPTCARSARAILDDEKRPFAMDETPQRTRRKHRRPRCPAR